MTNNTQKKGNTRETLKRSKADKVCTELRKQRKKSSVQCHKEKVEKDDHAFPSTMDMTSHLQLPAIPETEKELAAPTSNTGQLLHPSAKFKLQLFPIDERTRIILEKDGYHPYLELTLKPRKRITSILKHLNKKWGGSRWALGEPMLFPYNIQKILGSLRRWTLNDNNISAGDVYAAVGNPAIFRLRYGWFINSEIKTSGVPSTSTSFEACLQPQGQQIPCSDMECTDKGTQTEGTSEERKLKNVTQFTNATANSKIVLQGSVDRKDYEVKTDTKLGHSSLWADGLSNISIGGLLSQESWLGVLKSCEPKLNGKDTGFQHSQPIADSLDAFIASQKVTSQGPSPSSQNFPSSILDAEDTCHAFAFQKFSSLGNRNAYSAACSQDADSKSSKNPSLAEVNFKLGHSQVQPCQESETDLLLCSRVYNDESSLGLAGIKWAESLGPFDLGLSSQKIIGGDSRSFSGIAR